MPFQIPTTLLLCRSCRNNRTAATAAAAILTTSSKIYSDMNFVSDNGSNGNGSRKKNTMSRRNFFFSSSSSSSSVRNLNQEQKQTQTQKQKEHSIDRDDRWYEESSVDADHNLCNARYDNVLKICKTKDGKGYGLFAMKDFDVGEPIMTSSPSSPSSSSSSSHSVQIGWNEHVVMDLPAVLINHSCDANVGMRNNHNGKNDVIINFCAIRPIQKGEELTWDYETAEWELSAPFPCSCGSDSCRGTIRGYKHNGSIVRERYGAYRADYLK